MKKELQTWYELKHKQRRCQVYECMEQVAELRIKLADAEADALYWKRKYEESSLGYLREDAAL